MCKVRDGFGKGQQWIIFDLVVWTEPINCGECGLYTVFEVDFEPPTEVKYAAITCYYDGVQDRKKADPGYRTEDEARDAMRSFYQKRKDFREL